MRRAYAVTAVLVILCSVSVAQFGVKAGVDLASIYGDDASSGPVVAHIRAGFAGGVMYHIGLPYGFYVQPEVMYAQKGFSYDFSGGHSYVGKNDYLEIPVVVRWGPVPLSLFDSYVEVGASYGILLSAQTVDGTVSPTVTTDVKDTMEKGDFSILFGGGANFKLLSRDMRLGFRYVAGQSKIYKAVGTSPQPKITNGGGILALEVML